jgi:hypothetical protein
MSLVSSFLAYFPLTDNFSDYCLEIQFQISVQKIHVFSFGCKFSNFQLIFQLQVYFSVIQQRFFSQFISSYQVRFITLVQELEIRLAEAGGRRETKQ